MKMNLENANSFTVSVVVFLTVPLVVIYHLAFGQVHYTALMVVACMAIGLHMLSPFTPPRYKKMFDVVVIISLLLLVLLGVLGK